MFTKKRAAKYGSCISFLCLLLFKHYILKQIIYSDHIFLEIASRIVSEKINFNDTSK